MYVLFLSILFFLSFSLAGAWNEIAEATRSEYPQVIGHAGSSYYVPEESLVGYDLAARLMGDYAEPDLVLTSDGEFIAMHDLTLEGTTNVMDFPHFASRVSTFNIEGEDISGIYAINFTLAEIKTLRIRQRFASDGRSTAYDWLFQIPTLHEIIDWQVQSHTANGRLVGIMPELKHPDWYNEMGFAMEDMLLSVLKDKGFHVDLNDADTPRDMRKVVPVAIQCFKAPSLQYLATKTSIPLIQLMGISDEYPAPLDIWNPAILDEVSKYAQVASPDKKIFTSDWNVSLPLAMEMANWAHERGLLIMPWSFQPEASYVSLEFDDRVYEEMALYYKTLRVAAIFHEAPDMAVKYLAVEMGRRLWDPSSSSKGKGNDKKEMVSPTV